ncbi:uncharacterized protein LOC135808850 [Sycon ciliatum]|uniref:uncharacterized protein LOC135808850 n=1 Tax=Sycon ciliatum TaxID=27933 RepID=UPI0031F6B586
MAVSSRRPNVATSLVVLTGILMLFMSSTAGQVFTDFINDAGQPFDFQCGKQTPFYGYGMSGIASVFQSTSSLRDPSDRRWKVLCSPAETLALDAGALVCTEYGPINSAPGVDPLVFRCPGQGFLSGFRSTYDKDIGDRSWWPFCCRHKFGSVVDCDDPVRYLNTHGNDFSYTIPSTLSESTRRVLVGLEGSYVGIVPSRRDRTWKYTQCKLVVNCTKPPAPTHGGFSGGGQYLFNETVTYSCDDSYYLSAGSASRTCLNTGLWSGTLPTCTKCTAISNCKELRCTDGNDQWCDECDSTYPGLSSAYVNTNRTCDAICSWQRQFCYPGQCPGRTDTCNCSAGFTGESCLTITAVSDLSCSVELVDNGGGNRQQTTCSVASSSGGMAQSPTTFYSNVQLSLLSLQWDVSFISPSPMPLPAYIVRSGYSVGVVATHVSGKLTRASAPSTGIEESQLNCTGVSLSRDTPAVAIVPCSGNVSLSTLPLHRDVYQLNVSVSNGGYLTLQNFDTSMPERHFYRGATRTEVTNIVFDFQPPVHCSVGGTQRCSAGEDILNVGSPITRDSNITVTFGGWFESPSSNPIKMYTLERHTLEVTASRTVCEKAASNVRLAEIPGASTQPILSVDTALPGGDDAYSFVLGVEDIAGNVQYARRSLISDTQSSIRIDSAQPIRIASAYASQIDGQTVAWQPNTHDDISITASGHFYNTLMRKNNFMLGLCKFQSPILDAYDQPLSGPLPRDGRRSSEGIVEIYYAAVVNPASIMIAPDMSAFKRSTSTAVSNLTLPVSRKDSDTVVVWLLAYDLHNQTAMDYVVFRTDSTPPALAGLTLIVNTERTNLFNTEDLTKLAFEFESQDEHSGLQSLRWSIGTARSGDDIGQGMVNIRNNVSSCSPPSCICAQPLNAPCQSTRYSVSLASLPRQSLRQDHDYFLTIVSTNNAGLQTSRMLQFTVDVSPPYGGVVVDEAPGRHDVNFQTILYHPHSWSGFVDDVSAINYYQVYVGSSCLTAGNFTHPPQSMVTNTTRTDNFVVHAAPGTYYVTVVAVNNAYLISAPVCSDGVTIDTTAPVVEQVIVNNTKTIAGIAKDTLGQVWYMDTDHRRALVDMPSTACVARAALNPDKIRTVPVHRTRRGSIHTVPNSWCMDAANATFELFLVTPNAMLLSWQSSDIESGMRGHTITVSTLPDSSLGVTVATFETQLNRRTALFGKYTSGLEQGKSVYVHITGQNNALQETEITVGPIYIDATPPIFNASLTVVWDHSAGVLRSVIPFNASLDADFFTPISYSLAVGETPMDDRVMAFTQWTSSPSCTTARLMCSEIRASDLSSQLHSGRLYYVTLHATNAAGLSSTVQAQFSYIAGMPSAGMVLDTAPSPAAVEHRSGLDFASQDVDLCMTGPAWNARWHGFTHASHAIAYAIGLGSRPQADDVVQFRPVPAPQQLSVMLNVSNVTLQTDSTYYTVIKAWNAVGSIVVSSDGCRILGDTESMFAAASVRDGHSSVDIDTQISQQTVGVNWQVPSGLHVSRVFWKLQQLTPVQMDLTDFKPISSTGASTQRHVLIAGNRYRSVLRLCNANACYGDKLSDGFLVSGPTRPGSMRAVYNASALTVQVSWDLFNTSGDMAFVDYYQVSIGTSEKSAGEELLLPWSIVGNPGFIRLREPLAAYHQASATVRAHVADGYFVMAHTPVLWVMDDGKVVKRTDTLIKPTVYDLTPLPVRQPLPSVSSDWRLVEQQYQLSTDIQYSPVATRIAASWPSVHYPEVSWSLSDRRLFLPCTHGSTKACGSVKGTVLHADVAGLVEGQRYYVCISAPATTVHHELHNESLPGIASCSDGFVLDSKTPVGGCVWAGGQAVLQSNCTAPSFSSSTAELPVSWQAFSDVEAHGKAPHMSGVKYYQIGLGTRPSMDDVVKFHSVGQALSTVMRDLAMRSSIQYFATVRAYDFAGHWSQVTSNPVLVDPSPPDAGWITLGTSSRPLDLFISSRTLLEASWHGFMDKESPGLRYSWAVGSRPGGSSDLMAYTDVKSLTYGRASVNLADGDMVFISVVARNDADLSTLVTSPGFLVDTSAPSPGVVYDGDNTVDVDDVFNDADYTDRADRMLCRWAGFADPQSQLAEYSLAVGTCRQCTDVQSWMSVGLRTAYSRNDLPLRSGRTYYCRIRACNSARLCTEAVSDGITVDTTPPIIGNVVLPAHVTSNRYYSWAQAAGFHDPHSSVMSYRWMVGATAVVSSSDYLGPVSTFSSPVFQYTNHTSSLLPTSGTAYVSAEVRNHADAVVRQLSQPLVVDMSIPQLSSGQQVTFDELWGGSILAGTQTSAEGVRIRWQLSTRPARHVVTLAGADRRFAHVQKAHGSATSTVLRASLSDGETYTAHVTACNLADTCATFSTGPLLVDSTPPTVGYIQAMSNSSAQATGGTASRNNPSYQTMPDGVQAAVFTIAGFSDAHSGISQYTVSIGSSYFALDLANNSRVDVTNVVAGVLRVPLSRILLAGERLFVTVVAWNKVGLGSVPLLRSFIVHASTTVPGSGSLVLERSAACQTVSCQGHCTCPLNSGFCQATSSTCQPLNASSTSLVTRPASVFVTLSHRQATPAAAVSSIPSSRIVHTSWTRPLSTIGDVQWYDWSLGLADETPGSGVFNPATDQVWHPLGQRESTTISLAARQRLQHGQRYVVYVRAWFNSSHYAVFESAVFRPDLKPPQPVPGKRCREVVSMSKTSVDIDYTSSTDHLTVSWTGVFDTSIPSTIDRYEVGLGTAAGVDDTVQFTTVVSTVTTHRFSGLSLHTGMTYYASVIGVNGIGETGVAQSDGILVDTTPPVAGEIRLLNTAHGDKPIEASANSSDVRVHVNGANDPESGIAAYSLAVGTSPGLADVLAVNGSSMGALQYWPLSAADLSHNTTYYVALTVRNGAGKFATLASSAQLIYDTTRPSTYSCPQSSSSISNPSFEAPGAVTCPTVVPSVMQATSSWTLNATRSYVDVSSMANTAHGCISLVFGGGALQQKIATSEAELYTVEMHLRVANCFESTCRNETLSAIVLSVRMGTEIRSIMLSPHSPATASAWTVVKLNFAAESSESVVSLESRSSVAMVAVGLFNVWACNGPALDSVAPDDSLRVHNSTTVSLQQTYLDDDRSLLQARWNIADDESGIQEYLWAVGSVAGGEQYQKFTSAGQQSYGQTTMLQYMSHGSSIFVTVLAWNKAGQERLVSSTAHLVDHTPPALGPVWDGSVDTDWQTGLEISVHTPQSVDSESGIAQCSWTVASSRSLKNDILPAMEIQAGKVSRRNLSAMNTTHGQTVYSRVCCTNGAGLALCSVSDGVTILTMPPSLDRVAVDIQAADQGPYDAEANVIAQADGLYASWDAVQWPHHVSHYQLRIPGSSAAWTSVGTANGVVLRGFTLADGDQQLELRAVDLANQISDTALANFTVDTSLPSAAGGSVNISRLSNDSITLDWDDVFSSGSSSLRYEVSLGTDFTGSDILATACCTRDTTLLIKSRLLARAAAQSNVHLTLTAVTAAGLQSTVMRVLAMPPCCHSPASR